MIDKSLRLIIVIILLVNSSCVLLNRNSLEAPEAPGARTRIFRPLNTYTPDLNKPGDTDTIRPWRSSGERTVEDFPGGINIVRVKLPGNAEGEVSYKLNQTWTDISLIYSVKDKDFLQIGDKGYGPFHNLRGGGYYPEEGDHFYLFFDWFSNEDKLYHTAISFDGRVYPFGIADYSWGNYKIDWDSNKLIEIFTLPGKSSAKPDYYIRAGRNVSGPYTELSQIYTSPDFSSWFINGYNSSGLPFLIMDGKEVPRKDFTNAMLTTNNNKTMWALLLKGENKSEVHINQEFYGSYSSVSAVHLSDSGRFAFSFARDGKDWINVDGDISEAPGIIGSPVFIRDCEDVYYKTYDRETASYYIHLGEKTWGPYKKMSESNRWTGEEWLIYTAVSYDGSILGFEFEKDDRHQFVQINDKTYGPYLTAWTPYISPDGKDIAFRYTDYEKGHWVWWNGDTYGPYTDTGLLPTSVAGKNIDFLTDSRGNIKGFHYNIGGEEVFGIRQIEGGLFSAWGNAIEGGENYIFTREDIFGPHEKITGFRQTLDGLHTAIQWIEDGQTFLRINEWVRGPGVLEFRIQEDEGIIRILSRKDKTFILETIPLDLTLTTE